MESHEHDLRRPFKRPPISDQQKRRQLSLQRQVQNRQDAQQKARCLANTILSLQNDSVGTENEIEMLTQTEEHDHDFDVRQAARLKGPEARRWFAKQLMLPEWMIDVPDGLSANWYVCSRPAGKRCFVVSYNGTTVSRLRNGSMLHRFPSALPGGARTNNNSRSGQSYCILDCIFHELDQTYYVIDMVYWAGMSMYECTAEFRFFWLNSKLVETGACSDPSYYHKYRFQTISIYNSDEEGLKLAYAESVPYMKDGLLFYNKHSHYQSGSTPLVLVWKDENCSQYVVDTDNNGKVPDQQQVVLELLDDGRLATSDDPPVIFGCLNRNFIQKVVYILCGLENEEGSNLPTSDKFNIKVDNPTGLDAGNLLRFTVNNGGLQFADGKLEKADLSYVGKSNRSRAFADSYSKVVFQYMARHTPLRIEHLLASINSPSEENTISDTDMVG